MLRAVGRTDWDADKVILLRLYHALVRSKLQIYCMWLCQVGSDNTGYSSPCRVTHLSGSFSYFHCAVSLRQSGRNLSISATFETCNELCIKTQFYARKPAYDHVVNPKYLSHLEAQPHITPNAWNSSSTSLSGSWD